MSEKYGVKIPGGYFDETRHLYRDERGTPVLSSTQVFDVLGMIDLSRVKPEVLEWKREYGNAVHAASHYLASRDLDWDTLDDAIVPAVTGIEEFLQKVKFEPEAAEERRVHSLFGM